MKIKLRKLKNGFTLIELLVVIAIIGLLASIVVVSLSGSRASARDAKRISDLRSLQQAMELCFISSSCGGGSSQYPTYANYTAARAGGIGEFIAANNMPSDPLSTQQYTWVSAATTYCITSDLEDGAFQYAAHNGFGTNATAVCP